MDAFLEFLSEGSSAGARAQHAEPNACEGGHRGPALAALQGAPCDDCRADGGLTGPGLEQSHVKYERIAILYALGAHLTHLAKMEPKHADRDRRFIDAVAQYTKASRIDHLDPTPWTGRGSALLAKWTLEKQSRLPKSEEQSKLELKHAHDAFGFGMDEEHDYVPGLLGQVSHHSLTKWRG
eukprot:SM000004S15153  [mRNA]  locus=s4:1545152:1546088:+ [translate_table: standard]